MAFDERLADRVRKALARRKGLTERQMFGGLCLMLNRNMACGVLGDALIVRVPPEETAAVLKRKHARPFDFTGTPMRGFVVVAPAGLQTDAQLKAWVTPAADFAAKLPPKKK